MKKNRRLGWRKKEKPLGQTNNGPALFFFGVPLSPVLLETL